MSIVAPSGTSVSELEQPILGGQSSMSLASVDRTTASDAYKDYLTNSKLRRSK